MRLHEIKRLLHSKINSHQNKQIIYRMEKNILLQLHIRQGILIARIHKEL